MADAAPITILILSKNEEINLPHTLASVTGWATDVFVVDSASTDGTQRIVEEAGAHFVTHAWEGYARQKNWGLDNLPIRTPWVFILDADESITPELKEEACAIASADKCLENGFYVNRRIIFMDKWIRHCGYYPSWNVRFFRHGKARYEDRSVHEHMVVDGPVGYLRCEMLHNDRRGIYHFIEKHNWYSSLEARELFNLEHGQTTEQKVRLVGGGPTERRRWLKRRIWPYLPFRWLARWFSMYILKMGFLDGLTGFHFCLMLAIYEYQIGLKLTELRLEQRRQQIKGRPSIQPTEPAKAPTNT
jgi:glycosyltransferase involved in cell wall biosynthesis